MLSSIIFLIIGILLGAALWAMSRSDPEKIIVGARPQDFLFDEKEPEITGTVEIVEALGRMSLIHVAVSENVKITVETESERARGFDIGSKISLSLKHEKLHFFDKASQTRICNKIKTL